MNRRNIICNTNHEILFKLTSNINIAADLVSFFFMYKRHVRLLLVNHSTLTRGGPLDTKEDKESRFTTLTNPNSACRY